uniref:Myb-like domain-containing protein n=1 Tax=Haptolina brevifila TaxID=156173 RepID=A0A7S2HBT4_9EUKA|mmetsp:Transcript_53119/g.105597  ORF Transcript_53119/g.105597 Transcript_53119/m.105597 type:complete len:335 (+) Transcript_53119:63-1067(+)|eukprot:CAMPEP_0174716292 /NCGR_PEP_ID=MMETSP1094-20130205/23623_1 /TAXON_ID=156173 /ORGANISM="Chrysochromulina brevifilum, Strain UTEX LB 985" /LENGTH=334 /DNA_ID=CAMNT_0015915999 /DNA_START=60 /DNA_END=1064 /DNA_ORIENTATION=+
MPTVCGRHDYQRLWEPEEDDIAQAMVLRLGNAWTKIANALAKAGYTDRSVSSVRNRYGRILKAQTFQAEGRGLKNRCHLCGHFKRGHTCRSRMNGGPQVAIGGESATHLSTLVATSPQQDANDPLSLYFRAEPEMLPALAPIFSHPANNDSAGEESADAVPQPIVRTEPTVLPLPLAPTSSFPAGLNERGGAETGSVEPQPTADKMGSVHLQHQPPRTTRSSTKAHVKHQPPPAAPTAATPTVFKNLSFSTFLGEQCPGGGLFPGPPPPTSGCSFSGLSLSGLSFSGLSFSSIQGAGDVSADLIPPNVTLSSLSAFLGDENVDLENMSIKMPSM